MAPKKAFAEKDASTVEPAMAAASSKRLLIDMDISPQGWSRARPPAPPAEVRRHEEY